MKLKPRTVKRILARIPHMIFIVTTLIASFCGYTAFAIGVLVGWALCAIAWDIWDKMTGKRRKVIKIKRE